MVEKLKACPFCGDKDVSLCVQRVNGKTTIRSVRCSGCDAEGPYDYEDEPAVHAWNTRPTDEVEKLREAVIAAYKAGAREVHEAWAEADEIDRSHMTVGDCPDFTEAAHDYADALLTEKANG